MNELQSKSALADLDWVSGYDPSFLRRVINVFGSNGLCARFGYDRPVHDALPVGAFPQGAKRCEDAYAVESVWQHSRRIVFQMDQAALRIKAFCGTSATAVKTQIWIAICVYLLVAITKKQLSLWN